MRVAAVQFELRRETSVDGLLAHVEEAVAGAAASGARVVVFPELMQTGLLGAIADREVTTATLHDDYWSFLPSHTEQLLDGIRRLAASHEIDVLGGSLLRVDDAGKLRNTAFLAHRDGRLAQQDKIHLTPQEHSLGVSGGDRVEVSEIDGHVVGFLICADIQFPELSRYIARQGADVILCPSLTWNRRGVHRVKVGCQARAMENQLYVAMSPLVGHSGLPTDAPMHAVGEALVAGPVDKNFGANDGLLASATGPGQQIVLHDMDFARLERSRQRPEAPGVALQRPDVYARLAGA